MNRDMATDCNSYRRLLDEYRKRDNYDSVFRSNLNDLAGKLDFRWIRSCVAVGPGSGEHEIEFVRRLLPNLREFIAFEPDDASGKALKANFQKAQLPSVEITIMEKPVEDWDGVENPVDAILCFNVIFHVEFGARQQLLQKLRAQYLNPDGVIIVIENGSPDTSGYLRLMHGLGYVQDNWYADIEKEVLACGFSLDFVHDVVSTRDLSNPSDGVLGYIQLLFDNAISKERIRDKIAKIYSDPSPGVKHIVRKMSVFKNNLRECCQK